MGVLIRAPCVSRCALMSRTLKSAENGLGPERPGGPGRAGVAGVGSAVVL